MDSASNQPFVCKAEEVLKLKFVSTEEDFENESLTFSPQFAHQVFGDSESIYGYEGLKVNLYYTPGWLYAFVKISYDTKIDAETTDARADDVIGELAKWIPQEGFCTNGDLFLKKLKEEESFKPFGDKCHEYRDEDYKFEIYKVTMVTPSFAAYCNRLLVFLIWYIDGANFTDLDDENWTYYLTYKTESVSGHAHYSIVGFTSTYSFYHYPDKRRVRISQMLILPPFQRQGHGAKLLQAVYNEAIGNSQVYDVTVEDPSEEFVALRDVVDCRNASKLSCFQSPSIHQPFNPAIAEECRKHLKITKPQSQKIHEILRLKLTDKSSPEKFRDYRLFIKSRLNAPYKREQKTLERAKTLQKVIDFIQAGSMMTDEKRIAELETAFVKLELEYSKILQNAFEKH